MARLAPKTDVLRALFMRSGNQCAFPGCTQPLVNDKNKFIAQVCHIEAASEGGERFNPDGNDEHRRSYENLLILCYPHHIETNDVEEYPVDRLLCIKREHEQLFLKSDFKIDESELTKLSYEMEKYWSDIDRLNKLEHIFADSGIAMDVNGVDSFFDVIASAHDAVNGIEIFFEALHKSDEELKSDFEALLIKKGVSPELFSDIPYYENPIENRNWELHNLGAPNLLQRLRIDLVHVVVKFLEEYLKTHSNDLHAKAKFEKAKGKLKEYAGTAMHVD
ncbi:hypothetical protein [Alteromonas macleodii]|uniref:HNH endonuclease n=1 Tax=Alteromonas macleodii TaxID=28108 RepID=A0AB36FYR2_ALTMA|nr:hypothetical protein [Alteromonas macleodii]OES32881.1 hypothetical protein BFV95_1919 [Alteromonas macleodii]OES32909.1 hypothetical protein BFV94_1920 [Alteromonas macleodii]OES32971.1 hypothetical protein BFV93_1912 [Alteromonas macleodii]OES41489.1 hypothetical protein BFV96_1920 [Alteromonas macleodii]OZB93987.1 hypothetical protein BBP29_06055 [Alteromonas macleodii]|tara:strand:- start:290 stop:1120 length:831 start_codon:yes stop_codon:yes gene_type:complete